MSDVQYHCPECLYSSKHRAMVSRHFRSVHLRERNFQCRNCHKNLATQSTLAVHQILYSNESGSPTCRRFKTIPNPQAVEAERGREEKSVVSLLRSKKCACKVKNFGLRRGHLISCPRRKVGLQCNNCEKSFTERKGLRRHFLRFLTESGFLNCKPASDSAALDRRVIVKDSLFYCTECDYKTNQRGNINRHLKSIHFQEREFRNQGYKTSFA